MLLCYHFAHFKPKNIAKTVFSVEDMERFLSEVFVIFIRIAEFYMDIEPFAKMPLSEKIRLPPNQVYREFLGCNL